MPGLTPDQRNGLRALAATLDGVDTAAYLQAGRDPLEPVIGLGPRDVPVAIMGRDPGRAEVEQGRPLVGAGGRRVRRVLYQHLHHAPMPDDDAGLTVSEHFFWLNTVPYKPLRNRAWPLAVKRRFQPLVQSILLQRWTGEVVITLGREAFFWFGIGQPAAQRERLTAFWRSDRRFTDALPMHLGDGSASRRLLLYPLPHPSPLNRAWYAHFPDLLAARLDAVLKPHDAVPRSGTDQGRMELT